MTALGWVLLGVAGALLCWSWVWNSVLRGENEATLVESARVRGVLESYDRAVATDAKVLAAQSGEALAWKCLHRYTASNAAQAKGMKRLARRVKRLQAERERTTVEAASRLRDAAAQKPAPAWEAAPHAEEILGARASLPDGADRGRVTRSVLVGRLDEPSVNQSTLGPV